MKSKFKHSTLFVTLTIGILNTFGNIAITHATESTKPMAEVKTQFIGVYRYRLGDFQVTALSDGTLPQDLYQLLLHTNQDEINRYLSKSFHQNPVETSINAYLIDTGDKIILVDSGFGLGFNPNSSGKMLNGLRAAGYSPEQVTDILITHQHIDHIGGLSIEGKRIFTNATIYTSQEDVDFFMKLEYQNGVNGYGKHYFSEATQALKPYLDANKIKTFSGKTELFSGVTAIPAPGHTPGHSFYRVESRGKSLLFIGDLIHNAEVQLSRADITIKYDVNEKAAANQRIRQLREISQTKALIAGAHLPFPGLGQIRLDQKSSYTFVPVLYQDR